ncbi:MAG: hypothetical protein SFW62_06765, partial [Alphaproteobacteria bacterium]|nr:hypothetical protein [Alphaproteobacteria bacterium]
KVVSIFYREIHCLLYSKNFKGLFYWLRNQNGCWKTIPFYDPRFLYLRAMKMGAGAVKILGQFLYKKLRKSVMLSGKSRPQESAVEPA